MNIRYLIFLFLFKKIFITICREQNKLVVAIILLKSSSVHFDIRIKFMSGFYQVTGIKIF